MGRTPVERLTRLEQALGCGGCPPIFVKRDDLMGIGGGGHKLGKLEFLIGEALNRGCDTFITTGVRQSNHAQLSAAAAARAGVSCELVLTDNCTTPPSNDGVSGRFVTNSNENRLAMSSAPNFSTRAV